MSFYVDAVRSTRKDYAKGALNKADLPQNPLRLLSQWVEEAAQADPEDYNATCVATQGLSGGMNGRIVLLRALEGIACGSSRITSLKRQGTVGLT